MPGMTPLERFVAARLAADARIALAARGKSAPRYGEWRARGGYLQTAMAEVLIPVPPRDMPEGLVAHAARHDPARVLREVEAGRRMLTRYRFACQQAAVSTGADRAGWEMIAGALERDVADRAAVWSGHRDYVPAWDL